MPVFSIRSPEGATIHVQAPDAATAMHGAQQWAQQNQGYLKAYAQANANIASNNAGVGDVGRAIRAAGQGATFGFGDELTGAVNAGLTGAQNLAARLGLGQPAPYSMGDAYRGTVDAQRADDQAFAQRHPVTNAVAQIGGAMVAPGAMEGAAFVRAAPTLAAKAGRAAIVGGVNGALHGAGNATGGLADRAVGAAQGGASGAAMGAAMEPATAAMGAVANKGLGVAAGVANNAARMTGMAAPEQTAAQRLGAALAKDGTDVTAARAGWSGNSTPTLADLAGENLRAQARNAASSGPARQVMQAYRDGVAGDLQDNALALTRALTPDEGRTAQQMQADLLQQRADNAREMFAEPYAQTINITPEVVGALRDPEGRAAIDRAIAGSRARMDYEAVGDLQRLKSATGMDQLPGSQPVNPYYTLGTSAPPLPPTTGRALDRIQIALGQTGRALQDREGAGDLASGLFKRQGVINDALDSFEGLQDARTNFKNLTQQSQAVDLGLTGPTASPTDYAAALQAFGDNGSPAGVGYRQALADAIGRPTEGAVGALNRIATSTNQGLNLTAQFGQDAADAYRQGLSDELSRMSNANYMAPNTGSQTQLRAQDAGHGFSLHSMIGNVLSGIKNGPPLSDAERSAILAGALSTDPDDPLLAAMLKSGSASGKLSLPSWIGAYAPIAASSGGAGQSPQ